MKISMTGFALQGRAAFRVGGQKNDLEAGGSDDRNGLWWFLNSFTSGGSETPSPDWWLRQMKRQVVAQIILNEPRGHAPFLRPCPRGSLSSGLSGEVDDKVVFYIGNNTSEKQHLGSVFKWCLDVNKSKKSLCTITSISAKVHHRSLQKSFLPRKKTKG